MTRVYELWIKAPMELKARKGTGKLYHSPRWLNSNDRTYWRNKAELVKLWRNFAGARAREAKLPQGILGRVFIEAWVHMDSERAYDAQNFYPSVKACVDGIVGDYGLLPGDDNAHVVGPLCLPGLKATKDPGLLIRIHTLAPGELYPSDYHPYPNRMETLL
jgi:hypothetical protein